MIDEFLRYVRVVSKFMFIKTNVNLVGFHVSDCENINTACVQLCTVFFCDNFFIIKP